MPLHTDNHTNGRTRSLRDDSPGRAPPVLRGHALRNAHLRERALARAQTAPPLARAVVKIRAEVLQLTRLECARRAGISRGAMRDLELGIHTPMRHTLQQFLALCRQQHVAAGHLEELQQLYTGPVETLGQLLARLELRAGSARELARRVGISATTLWEYRRGNFPLPLALLVRLCRAVGDDSRSAEALWQASERRRFLERGLPEAWAELCLCCARAGHPESRLLQLGVSTTAFRRLRYLELPPWSEVAGAARQLTRNDDECVALQKLWVKNEQEQRQQRGEDFGSHLKELRLQRGIPRRELADLFGIGGKKPARVIKHIEDDGHYSAQAYPAGLAAVLASEPAPQSRLVKLWRQRRCLFLKRRRPETRTELRLAREQYGFGLRDMEAILGYTSLEYQRIERGVTPLLESACARIMQAVHQAGARRVQELLQLRAAREAERSAWQVPPTVAVLVALLARREGGYIPLARCLRRAGVHGLWPGRLRAVAGGKIVPAWPVVQRVAQACGVRDLTEAREDWSQSYRRQLQQRCASPLGVELRLLIAEVATSLREFSPRLGFNYSVLVREFQRIDRDAPLRWFHIERVLTAVGLSATSERWREIRALWSTAETRRKRGPIGSRTAAPREG